MLDDSDNLPNPVTIGMRGDRDEDDKPVPHIYKPYHCQCRRREGDEDQRYANLEQSMPQI
jgi:hypothetical protein